MRKNLALFFFTQPGQEFSAQPGEDVVGGMNGKIRNVFAENELFFGVLKKRSKFGLVKTRQLAGALKLFIASKANLARGLKNGWGRLVYTILISNLTRLIH